MDTISCRHAQELATIINQSAQIEDLLASKGMESELKSMSLPVPTQIPLLAEDINDFNNLLHQISMNPTNKEIQNLSETNKYIRKEAAPFLLAAFTNCVISTKGGDLDGS